MGFVPIETVEPSPVRSETYAARGLWHEVLFAGVSRTNVAVSRAKALAVLVGSPALGEVQVETVGEFTLQSRYAKWLRQNFA